MKKPFAKLFENEEYGQILVKIDSSDEGENEAEVRLFFEPEGFGVCSTAFHFSDWDKAEEAFEKIDEKLCVSVIAELVEKFGGLSQEDA